MKLKMLVTVVVVMLAVAFASALAGSEQRVRLSVTKNGFEPAVVTVRAGQPVVLLVTRKTDRTCATELVLKAYDINEKLPLNKTVSIRFTPRQSGTLQYACGMDMYKGKIVVK